MGVIDLANEVWQNFYYGLLHRRPNIDFTQIPDQFKFISHYDSRNKVHWIETPELPDFVVSGKTTQELARNVYDTLMVYYDVPTYFARRMKPDIAQLEIVNQKTKQTEVVNVDYKDELERVLA